MGPDYQVVTANDGFTALDELESQRFDLVVTDFNMGKMDGLELLEAIRYRQPAAQIIMITAYGSDFLEAETYRLQVYRYLHKPLEIEAFRQIVKEALANRQVTHPENLALSAEQHQKIDHLLAHLRKDVSARCLFLADVHGHILARSGDADRLPREEIATLLGSSIATLNEAGRTVDGKADAVNLTYRESEHQYLYGLNIGRRLLMVLIIDRGQYSSRLGTVWYYAQQTAAALGEIMAGAEYAHPRQLLGQGMHRAIEAEFDK